jgi:hypothetical protein
MRSFIHPFFVAWIKNSCLNIQDPDLFLEIFPDFTIFLFSHVSICFLYGKYILFLDLRLLQGSSAGKNVNFQRTIIAIVPLSINRKNGTINRE